MARKQMAPKVESKTVGKHRREKQPTQKTPQQRILVINRDGKRVLAWRDWPVK